MGEAPVALVGKETEISFSGKPAPLSWLTMLLA